MPILLLIPSVLFVVALTLSLLFCLKIKSSKKDPALAGIEGTISTLDLGKDVTTVVSSSGGRHHRQFSSLSSQLTPSPTPYRPAADKSASSISATAGGGGGGESHNVSSSSNRTPSRSGERKLPDIPRDDDSSQSDLYATLDGEGGGDYSDYPAAANTGGGGALGSSAAAGQGSSSSGKEHHPYAKVKKGKVEHPYATVKKLAPPLDSSSTGAAAAATASSANGGGSGVHASSKAAGRSDLAKDFFSSSSSSSSLSSEEDSAHKATLLPVDCPSRSSRTGSGRSGQRLAAASSHQSVIVSSSRQATPLPMEPNAAAATAATPVQYFSGDSQDSSKGYTSISVREPIRHIQMMQRPPSPLPPQDSTYATVSETSDDMYAAIEDPTYSTTGGGPASQSNSDTYAVIDLPEVEMAPDVVDDGDKPYHPYSRVNKIKKPPPQQQQQQQQPPSHGSRRSYNVEDMYAKVRKRSSLDSNTVMDDLGMDAAAGTSSSMELLGGRRPPGMRSAQAEWSGGATAGAAMDEGKRHLSKAEINYSDYEVSLYDSEKRSDDLRRRGASSYEPMPETEWKKQRFDSNDGYETLPAPEAFDKDPNYELLPDYWRSNNSGGYETVRGDMREPGYEVVGTRNGSGGGGDRGDRRVIGDYASVYQRKEYKDPDYETVVEKSKEPPYAKLLMDDNGSDGYETIPGAAAFPPRMRNEYDPGYEILSRPGANSEPGYETVASGRIGSDVVAQQRLRGNDYPHQTSVRHLPVRREEEEGPSFTPNAHQQRRAATAVVMKYDGEVDLPSSATDVDAQIFV